MKRKNLIGLLFVAVLLLKGTCAYATVYNGVCGEQVFWTYNDSTCVLNIHGSGAITDKSGFSAYKSSVKRIEVEEGVTSIVTSAFSNSPKLDTVIFASSVEMVGGSAFQSCTALKYCDLGRGVKYIGGGVFFFCKALQTLKWSNCLETIAGCILQNYNFDSDSPTPTSLSLTDTLYFPASFKSNHEVIYGNTPYVDAVVWNAKHPADPTKRWDSPLDIGSSYGWSFKKIIFGDSVEYIPNYLCNTYNGDSIVLPEGVKEIGKYSFQNCSKLTHLSLPTSLRKIGANAFENCPLLPKVVLPEGLQEIGPGVFYRCSALARVNIPEGVTAIGDNAFASCPVLDSIVLPESATMIGSGAFSGAVLQQELVIPDKVVAVGSNAFENWSALREISIGKNVTLLGDNAFKGDSAVTHITVWAAVPPMVSEGTLADIPDSAWLSVLPDSRKLYREHPYWGRFRMSEVPDSAMIQRTVTVDAAETTADFTWPTDSAAYSYQIDIYKNGVVFCKLTLGNKGQLLAINFSAPRRRMSALQSAMPAAEDNQPYTLSFKVTGLDEASRYNYVLSVLDANGKPLHVYIGDFATLGYEGELKGGGEEVIPTPPIIPSNPEQHTPEGIENTFLPVEQNGKFVFMNGEIRIIRDGRVYTIQGQLTR